MAIKRMAPAAAQQELTISDHVVYKLKSDPISGSGTPTARHEPVSSVGYLTRDLLRTVMTILIIGAVIAVSVWRGWLH